MAEKDVPKKKKRGQGRPVGSENGVGREALINAACALLRELPPTQVTIAAIGRAAGVDPALVRYYFGDRQALLFEAAKIIAGDPHLSVPEDAAPTDQLSAFIHRTFHFTRSARYMQRLMAEELSNAKSPEVLEQLRAWHQWPVEFYETLQERDDGKTLAPFDALFLHLAVIGISDFFQSGEPVVRMLAPEGANLEELRQQYESFVTNLLLNGLRKR
jgi:AcrR family transcriptional regulator